MNVLKMNCEGSCILSNAEIEAMSWNEVACHKHKLKGKCTGECNNCQFGQGHALMNAVDPFQRMVINDRVDRHIMNQSVTIGDVADKVVAIAAWLFILGFYTLIGIGIYKAGRYAQWW